jgi:hypothetical protein
MNTNGLPRLLKEYFSSMRFITTLSSSLMLAASLPAADQDELSRQATDPTASLMAINFPSGRIQP